MTHPTFPELARAATHPETRTAELAEHVEGCALCQLTIAAVLGEPSDAVWDLDIESKATDHLPSPARGQVWRLEWMEEVAFAAIADVGDITVDILPIVESPELVEDSLIEWSSEDSPVGFSAALWRGPRLHVPLFVLDRFYAQVELPGTSEAGSLPTPYSDAAYALISSVTTVLESFKAQSWVPRRPNLDWDAAMGKAGISYKYLADALGWTAHDIKGLKDGSRVLTEAEQMALAKLLGTSVEGLPGPAALTLELVRSLNRPALRPAIRARAAEASVDEGTARLQAAKELVGTYHRSSRDVAPQEFWDRVVDDYFNR